MVIIRPATSAPAPPRPTIGHTLAVLGSVRAGAVPAVDVVPAGVPGAADGDAGDADDAAGREAGAGDAPAEPDAGDASAASTWRCVMTLGGFSVMIVALRRSPA